MFVYYAGWLNAKAGRLADWSGRRDKMLKSGTVPPKTGRMVSLHLPTYTLLCSQSALTGLKERFGSFQAQHKCAHDHQRTFRIMIISAATECNIRLIEGTILTSHTGIAYHVAHNAQRTPPHHGCNLLIYDQCWVHGRNFVVKCEGGQLGVKPL